MNAPYTRRRMRPKTTPQRPAIGATARAVVVAACVLAGAVALLGADTTAHAANPRDRRFASARRGLVIEAPPGWTISEHTGYQETVVLLLHPDGSRISVTAAATTSRDAATLFE